MIQKRSVPSTKVALLLVIVVVAFSFGAADRHTLILDGQSTDVLVIFVGGHPYVDLQALAKALHGSFGSSGAMATLDLPVSSAGPAPSSSRTAR